jgi:hypothetical protein
MFEQLTQLYQFHTTVNIPGERSLSKLKKKIQSRQIEFLIPFNLLNQ